MLYQDEGLKHTAASAVHIQLILYLSLNYFLLLSQPAWPPATLWAGCAVLCCAIVALLLRCCAAVAPLIVYRLNLCCMHLVCLSVVVRLALLTTAGRTWIYLL